MLRPGGRLGVISFHSLEDRIVKRFMRERERGCTCPPDFPVCVCGNEPELRALQRRPIRPGQAEVAANPRSASALPGSRCRKPKRERPDGRPTGSHAGGCGAGTETAYTACAEANQRRPVRSGAGMPPAAVSALDPLDVPLRRPCSRASYQRRRVRAHVAVTQLDEQRAHLQAQNQMLASDLSRQPPSAPRDRGERSRPAGPRARRREPPQLS
jgi:hypothetical protein